MHIERHMKVPTGDILVVDGHHGALEMISVGDYGKAQNIKADFLGLTDDINGVEHGELMPLSEKWVITISTQYGCSMGCPYCDVPKVGAGKNATFDDLVQQVLTGIHLHPEVKSTNRLNVHFARMGEPSWNPHVLDAARWMWKHLQRGSNGEIVYRVHPVVSTIMPRKNAWLKNFIHTWMRIKNRLYEGEAGLQVSLNSTDDEQREYLFNGNAHDLLSISRIMEGIVPFGRKIALNIALTSETIVDPGVLGCYFSPERYMVKITPMHETAACRENDLHTNGGYHSFTPYRDLEGALCDAGYDVIVFIPSVEEDAGLITCGNAVLSGSQPAELR